MPTTLPLDQLIADPAVHPRTRIRQGTIRQYADSYKRGDTLPPLDVFKSPDGRHFLADGFHRLYGARAAGHADIAVELFEGDVREATRYACGANARHAIPRTREDKWFEVAAVLCESDFAGTSDAEIAQTCRVSRQMIAKVRPHASSKEAFQKYMDKETERRTLAREDKQIARKKAKAEAKAAPPAPPTPPMPDRPLTPQEEALAALARAAEAASLARKAMAECERAYPEAHRFEAMIAICEAQCQLDELLPRCGAGVPPAGSGNDVPAGGTPAPQRVLTGRVSEAGSQPAKLHESLPAPSHSLCGAGVPPAGSGNGVPAGGTPAPQRVPTRRVSEAGSQPAKLHPEPAPRRIPPAQLADLFAPRPVHPMIAALSEGTIRNVPEVLPIQAKMAKAQPFANPLLPPQPAKLHPSPNNKSSRRSRRRDKNRRSDGPQSSRSPPAA